MGLSSALSGSIQQLPRYSRILVVRKCHYANSIFLLVCHVTIIIVSSGDIAAVIIKEKMAKNSVCALTEWKAIQL